jgi:hypothetical protein
MLYPNPLSMLDVRWNPIPASWERQVASSEERVAKFLKRPLEHRSALEVAQSLSAPSPQHAPRIPGGSSVSLSATNKRWDMIPHSAEGRRDLRRGNHIAAVFCWHD